MEIPAIPAEVRNRRDYPGKNCEATYCRGERIPVTYTGTQKVLENVIPAEVLAA